MGMTKDLRSYFHLACVWMLTKARDEWQLHLMMEQECCTASLRELLTRQRDPLRQQISRLEQIVDRQGGMIGADQHPEGLAMLRAHWLFLESNPPAELLDLHNALQAEAISARKIAAYQGLLEVVASLELPDAQHLLQANLESEMRRHAAFVTGRPALLVLLGERMRPAA